MVTDRRARRLIVCAAALYLLGVARMTLWPDFASPDELDALRSLVAWLTGHGVPVTYDGVEAAANVVMFVPFGVLGGLLVSRRHRATVVAAARDDERPARAAGRPYTRQPAGIEPVRVNDVVVLSQSGPHAGEHGHE